MEIYWSGGEESKLWVVVVREREGEGEEIQDGLVVEDVR